MNDREKRAEQRARAVAVLGEPERIPLWAYRERHGSVIDDYYPDGGAPSHVFVFPNGGFIEDHGEQGDTSSCGNRLPYRLCLPGAQFDSSNIEPLMQTLAEFGEP